MSREIKFRVWDKVAKAMHVCETNSHDTFFFDPHTCDFTYYNLQNGETSNGHSDYILEQYTGLKDKNGKEIYEGDIVKITRELTKTRTAVYIYQIKYDGSRAAFTCWKNNHFACMFFESNEGECEIIGNVHQNPELLEDK